MEDLVRQTERAISDGRRLVADNQSGGRHRMAKSVGKGAAQAKMRHWLKRGAYLVAAIFAMFVASGIIGGIIGGIGTWGVMALGLAVMIAVAVFFLAPKPKPPKRAELGQGNPKQMVARTELWLEAQRSALPAPAVAIVDRLGLQLDALGEQLATIEDGHPAMGEVRELVGEYIPETIDNYRKIPEHLRGEEHAGKTADERLVTSLTKISGEVDRVTRRLAEGALDDLAVKSRYLEYRYGGDEMIADMTGDMDSGVPLPDFTAETQKQSR